MFVWRQAKRKHGWVWYHKLFRYTKKKSGEMDKLAKEIIRPFNGEGDMVAWMKKLKLVTKLQKITDLVSFIPFFLEGDTLALYLEMSEEDQQDEEMIEVRLEEAFMEGPFEACEKLKKIKWTSESVDMYTQNIKRLAGYVGRGLDQTAKLAFVMGFPDSISMTLQQLPGMNKMEITDLVPTAKVLTRTQSLDSRKVGAVAHSEEPTNRCQEPHWLRDHKVSPRTKIMYYNCKKFGHIARYYPLVQVNKQGGVFAQAAAPSTEWRRGTDLFRS